MRQVQFHNQLLAATHAALRFGQSYVRNRLYLDTEFVAVLNQSYDANRASDEVVYPADEGRVVEGLSDGGAVDLLHRGGRVPAWIDISVLAVANRRTVMRLLCCGRYRADEERLYYHARGSQPFGIKSPDFPPSRWGQRFWLPRAAKALARLRGPARPRSHDDDLRLHAPPTVQHSRTDR